FRISKYCGEHLIVGNEVHWEPLDGDTDEESEADESYHPSYGTGTETAGNSASSWRERTANEPPATTDDGIANGAANDVPSPDDGGEDLRDDDGESLAVLPGPDGYVAAPYRRLVRAGTGAAPPPPRAEALQAATVHSFHNLKILKPVDDDELEEVAQEQHNETDIGRNQQQQQQQQQQKQQQEAETATRNRNRQRQKVFSQDFRVLKILPSNLDVVEDIKQIGNEYYFKKDVEVVVDDSENEIVDSAGGTGRKAAEDAGQPATSSNSSTGVTSGGMTETLDIVVLPAPTKDIEIYDNELVSPDGGTMATDRPDDDISVIGLITPTRTAVTSSPDTASGEDWKPSTGRSTVATVETTLGHWDVDRLDLPESAEGSVESRSNFTGLEESTSAMPPPFSFNNRTFQTMQETVRQENQGPYPPLGSYDEEEEDDDFEDEDVDADEDQYDRKEGGGTTAYGPEGPALRLDKTHKKYMSVQRTLLKHPLRQGFLMTPSYPKYYIGDSTCRWTLYAGVHQRIKLTVLDLALRYDEECRDYLQVVDLNTNQTLFRSCTESSRPIEIVSIQERLEVSVRTTTKVIYPKRGVLIHYTGE
uniref:CUB domain-containing protein n=1 Tax=Anopheles epiroticus TaxID=199890 RepID=A0A182PPN5_9DIPT